LLRLKASHTIINSRAVTFTGTGGQLFVIIIVHFILLTGITLGLYLPWAVCKFFSWRAQNTLVGGTPSQFTGTGGALFMFFLLHLLILPLLTLGLYYIYGTYRLYAWREERTKYGGERTSFGAGFGGFLAILFVSWILNTITLTLFTPWAMSMFYKWQIGGLAVGLGEGVRHFPPVKANPVLVILLILLCLLPFAAAYYFYWPKIQSQSGPLLENMENLTQLLKSRAKDMKQKPPLRGPVKGRAKEEGPKPGAKPEGRAKIQKEPATPASRKRPPVKKAALSQSSISNKKARADLLNYNREIKELDDLIERDGKNAVAFFSRGWLYAAKGDLQKAERDYTRAVELDDTFGEAYYNRSLVYVKMKEHIRAIKDFTKTIKLDGRAVDAYCNRGSSNFELGKIDLALRDYNQALKIKRDDAELLYNRGIVFLSQKKKEKAMADFEKASKLGNARARRYLKEQADLAKKPEAISKTAASISWKMDLSGVQIPGAVPSGRIHGEAFVSTSAKIDHGILTIRDGKGFHPEHAVMVFLFLKKGETAEGKSFNVTKTSGFGSPHIHMKWKEKGSKVPKTKMFMKDYVMRLTFGFIKNGELPGKIYLCMPDKEKSYVAGSFRAAIK
jgi:tetratricopeptide (TPR) repeat protein